MCIRDRIFIPIIALLPIPVITILPRQDFNVLIISQKFESITLERLEIDLDSKTSVSRAIFFIICWLAKMGNLF